MRTLLGRVGQRMRRRDSNGASEASAAAGPRAAIRGADGSSQTAVDAYWGDHTVKAKHLSSPEESEAFLEWRFDQYPLFREFSGLWGDHSGEVVLDYGCGPGNDLTGLALHSGAERLIGMDVSEKALALAAERLALHRIDPERVDLVRISDSDPSIPLEDSFLDHVNCQGVIHHVTDPDATVAELHRVLRPGGSGVVMVYNRNSVWFHLYAAYEKMILEDAFPGLDVHEAFSRTTDGPECPISRSYPPDEFGEICRRAGFEVEFVGGYPSRHELKLLQKLWAQAIADSRLGEQHRTFLRELTYDVHGYPMNRGMHAGIGGVYRLAKPRR
jgi:ubiquinone/menaquinone biosynthesis C-methylase UbiE